MLQQVKASYLVTGEAYEDTSEHVEIEEIKIGTGPCAEKGDAVVIAYKGTLQSDGSQFDAAKKFQFHIGGGEVVKGMEHAVLGMHEGGRRKVIIPASLGYGKRGSNPDIPPDATLIFDVTLKNVLQT